jgi:hypothetical protein
MSLFLYSRTKMNACAAFLSAIVSGFSAHTRNFDRVSTITTLIFARVKHAANLSVPASGDSRA